MFNFHTIRLKGVSGISNLTAFIIVFFSSISFSFTANLDDSYQWEGIQLQTSIGNIYKNNEIRVIRLILNVNLQACIKHCQRRKVCHMIVYHTHTHLCALIELLSGSFTNENKTTAANFVFGLKSSWTDDYPSCSICPEREVCKLNEAGRTVCHVNECTAPPIIADALFLGNKFTVGSRLLYQCNNNLSITSSVFCQPDGLWSTVDLTCLNSGTPSGQATSTLQPATSQTTTQQSTNQTTTQQTTPLTTTQQANTPTMTQQANTPTPPTTTTQQTTVQTSPSCPIETSGDTITYEYGPSILNDDINFVFLVVNESVTQFNALLCCTQNYNGSLVKILTSTKMVFLVNLLRGLIDSNGDFWVDARRVNGSWVTSEGDSILSDDAYWDGGLDSGEDSCTRIRKESEIMFNDRDCNQQFAFICEKIIPAT